MLCPALECSLFLDQTLQSQYLNYQPEPTSIHLMDTTTGKVILPTPSHPSPPSTIEMSMGYSSLWSPANLNGFPLFGGPSMESYIETSAGGLTAEANEFTIMFWFRVDAGLFEENRTHTLLDFRRPKFAAPAEPIVYVEDARPKIRLLRDDNNFTVITIPERYNMTEEKKWHFLAITYSQPKGKGAMYIDDKKGYHIEGEADPVFVSSADLIKRLS